MHPANVLTQAAGKKFQQSAYPRRNSFLSNFSGGLKENYEVKFKNHLREGQASELILMRDIVVKRNGKFVTQTATPLIVATRIANEQVVVDVIQKNRGRKSTLGTGMDKDFLFSANLFLAFIVIVIQ